MARPLRLEFDGALYHITCRGNARQPIFFGDEDRELFLNVLASVNKKHHWICHAYCLMKNHYHLLIETTDGNLSIGMRQLNGVFAQSINTRHQRVGHLFQGRYKAILVQKDSHLKEVARYISLNPVRAKIVDLPDKYLWSSFSATTGLMDPPSCLTIEWIQAQFGNNGAAAQKAFRDFVLEDINKEEPMLKNKVFWGDAHFAREIAKYFDSENELEEIPRKQRNFNRPTLRQIFTPQNQKNKKLRNELINRAIIEWGYSQKAIADYLGLHYSTISVVNSSFQE